MDDDIILDVNNISKQYRLGVIGTGTLSHDLNRWWCEIRGKEDPYLRVDEKNITGDNQYMWALKGISFKVKRGEILGIIGKNGAGKSTLLKIFSRITKPTIGTIKSKGTMSSLLEVGTGFHLEMTGVENIFLNGAILGMTKKEIRSKLDNIIDFSGCKRYIDTPVKRYSSGMRVRLAFSVAAFLEPDILVVDEVLAVGDANFQKKAIGKMKDISSTGGRTVLFVSHDMLAISNLCQRVIVIKDGKIGYSGSTDDAISWYSKDILADNFSMGSFDLSNLDYRRKSNMVKLSSLEICDNKMGLGDKIASYGSGSFKIKFEIKSGFEINQVGSSIIIKDNFSNPLLTFSTRFRKEELQKKSFDAITCDFEEINLIPGEYIIEIWLFANGELVSIEDAAKIQITENDVFNSGFLPKRKVHGPLLTTNFKWK